MSSSLPELLAQFDRQRGKGYSVGARLSDPIIAALRAEVTAWETAFAQRVTEQCATYRDEWEESEERARVAEQALTDVLPSLLRQLQFDREQSIYWQERWTDGRDGEIEAWLLSLIDFDWTPANVAAGGASTTGKDAANE
jgi:hypothetical protein